MKILHFKCRKKNLLTAYFSIRNKNQCIDCCKYSCLVLIGCAAEFFHFYTFLSQFPYDFDLIRASFDYAAETQFSKIGSILADTPLFFSTFEMQILHFVMQNFSKHEMQNSTFQMQKKKGMLRIHSLFFVKNQKIDFYLILQ